uniref:fibronectin type III domain-containing protein 1 isoform X2 n=1 Tax=Gasterosteus aculeatus aculeatus TaxID=481459 RepID=UPI001A994DB4|nr:fibronectin type III domain-containing protein 1 isoform X2 [Gasterosteus aculeatus aculeatus]
MALAASRTLLALFVAFCAPAGGWAEKSLRSQNGKQTFVDKGPRESWEPSIHLDGRPVDRFVISSNKPTRSHRLTKGKDSRSHVLEDVDPEWVNLDGFAVLGGAPVRNSSAGQARSPQTASRSPASVQRSTRVNRTAQALGGSNTRRTHRRAPQSSSGPRQPERALPGAPPLERRRQHHTKPQSDQRNRNTKRLTSESVHVVSLQAQKALGQSAPANRAAATKTTASEPPEYEARDISVRVMSPQSVLISWVDPAVEMGKVGPEDIRSYTVRYREKGESARWEYKDSTQRRMMIDTLSADGMYEFSVRISQRENHGKWSVSVFQRTPESAPSGPPENFEVKPLRGKGTAVIATWDPPEEPNGRIREYILSYAPAMKPFGMKSVTHRGSSSTATLDGLTPGERYIFKIRATNRRGQGPQSKVLSVVMPGSGSAASTFSKSKDVGRTVHTPSEQDTDHDESDTQSAKATEEPTTQQPPRPRSAAPAVRRVRPLSQSRSYHNVFSSVRGSVRNTVNRGSSRGRAQGREDEDEEEKKIFTTASPVEETTTAEVVLEKKEPDNDVSPEFEDGVPQTTETPSLKVLTRSPIISHPKPPPRRPIKIRVHKKTGSKAAPSSSSFSSSSSPTSPASASSLDSSVSSTPAPQIQESAASRKDYVALTHPETKDTYDKQSTTQTKPSSRLVKDSNPQETEAASVGRGSVSADRTKGSGSRYGYSRKHPGNVFRGNSTRLPNGYKPAVTSQLNLPSGSSNRATSNARSAAASRPALQDRTPPERDTTNGAGSDDSNDKGAGAEATKKEEPTSSSSQTAKEERGQEEAKEEGRSEKPVVSRTGISPAFAARFPWLASRYPGRFGSGTRASTRRLAGRTSVNGTSSSAAAGRSALRATTGAASAAAGAAGVSTMQETSDDLRTADSLKNVAGVGLVKPSLTNKNTASSDAKNPTTSSSSSSSSFSATSSNSDPHHSSGRHTASNEPVPQETSNSDNNNDHNKDYLGGEKGGKYDEVAITSVDPKIRVEDNDGVETRETFSRKRPELPSGGTHSYRRPGVGGNRQFGGARLPIRPKPAQNSSTSGSSSSSSDSSSSNLPQVVLTSGRDVGSGTTVSKAGGIIGGNSQSTSSSSASSSSSRGQGGRPRYPMVRGKPTNGGKLKPTNGNGKNGRPNLTATSDKDSSSARETSKAVGQKFITGPDGTNWIVDLEKGVLMNQDGQVLQDSQGRPKRVVLGADGRTIFDDMGSPLLNQEGMALFGHGRDGRPVVNPKDKVLMLGGKPVVGLDRPRLRTTTTTTTAPTTTTTTTAPTTTPEPTTTGWIGEESTTAPPFPTCPPGTFSKTDEYGYPLLDMEGILDCYPEEESSGMEMDIMVTVNTVPDALELKKDELFVQTTMQPTTTTTEIPTPEPDTRTSNHGPSSELDLSGKKRFTAPYMNYIQKDPASPCSLTEALEYLQVDVLENLMEKDSLAINQNQPPKHKPHNLTVVAMEGCHSFIILDWGRPLRDDMVSGYMVHSASYDDVLNNRWSTKPSSGSHLPLENLKPNSRYYFKVQAKNVFGLGPVSDTLTYVTESDDPLLIERPPGGEPIWIPFTFKYNSAHSSCKGSQYVKRTWYRKFVGVVLCNSLRYKIFMGDGLREPFYSIGDTFGQGEDQCQFVDSYRDGRTGPAYLSNNLPSAQGFYRAYRQQPVSFGVIGRRTPHPFVGWYECGVPIPGKW